MEKLVSVLITSYNRPLLLRRAILSVFNQTYSKIELIVIDDNSSYEVDLIIKELQEVATPNIKNFIYKKNPRNMGANFSRNRGLKHAKGFFITGLDDDDYFKEDRLQILVNHYNKEFSFICDNYIIVTGTNNHARFQRECIIDLQSILKENEAGNQILVERERLLSVGGFSIDFKRLQDQDVWTKLIQVYGSARRLNANTYYMDVSHEGVRITKNIKDYVAYRKYYFKYKNIMYNDTKNYNLFRLMMLRRLKIKIIFSFIAKKQYWTLFATKLLLKRAFPGIIYLKQKVYENYLKKRVR
ncbi:glycosyltransferase [Escherichia coli]|nr:glycosyltransferase [Escherichia coli]MBY8809687.1 glycosyltransferase [Escherichia coli]MCU6832418.1 glycosyltransferase [Escherichia coli]MCU6969233.1 glycosyltransferase [Escherichia coli]HAW1952492.1 glycosyltransferase [Escherichia coli]